MAPTRLIHTKLHPPRVTSPLVARPRLTRLLEAHSGRLVLVSAPAGFGKTVLVADWLAGLEGPRAWLSLDRLDNDPSRFCAHLAATLANLRVEGSSQAAELIDRLAPPDLAFPPALVEAFLDMGPDPIIVLDDLHELGSPGVLAVVEELVKLPGRCPRLVFLTREDPPFPTGRLRVSGELLEIRAKDLRFTDGETIELFERLLPGVLDPDQIRRLDQRTEGWVAGLRLAAIAFHDAEDPAVLLESFAGTHRFVMDYLLEEAFERQTTGVQQFLMETSILNRFSGMACTAITCDKDAAARLSEVKAAGLFLVSLGGDGEWYRYHHLFAELLRFRLRTHQPDRLDELHRRASEWFETEGDISTALEHASQMSDQQRLLNLLDAHVQDMLCRSELDAIQYWTSPLRDPLSRPYPMVLCILGWLRVLTDRAPDLDPVLRAIETALDRVPAGYDPDRKRQAALHLEVLGAFAARYSHQHEEALRIGTAALTTLTAEDSLIRGLLVFNMARVRMVLAEMGPAAELFEQSWPDHLRSGNAYLMLASMGQSAAVAAQTRSVQWAIESLADAVTVAEERGLTRYGAFSVVLYHRGYVEDLKDELDKAAHSFQAALELGRQKDFPEGMGNGMVGLARVAMVGGRFDEAEALLVEASALGRGSNLVLMDTTLDLERTRLALAREAAEEGPPIPYLEVTRNPRYWTSVRETELTLAVQQALRGDRHDLAGELIEELRRESEIRGRGAALCTAFLAQALLPECTNRWEILDQSLSLAATRGYVRPFLDGGEPVRAALRAAMTHTISSTARVHARLILDRFAAQGGPDGPPTGSHLPEPLTNREEEILNCLVQGQSNKAIAKSLFVSADTVKTHLKHIYAKLGVRDRNAAVIRAREIGLDPGAGS